MAIKPFELSRVVPPKLKFAGNNIETIPLIGLKRFGPYDLESRNFEEINLMVITPEFARDEVLNFINIMKEYAKKLLRININIIDTVLAEKYHLRRITDYISLISGAVKNVAGVNIIFQVLTKKIIRRENNYYIELRKQMIHNGIAVQSITLPNLVGENIYEKAGNVLLGIYAKVGGTPWQLADPISLFFRDVIHIGYGISKTGDNKNVLIVTAYDNTGRLIFSSARDIPVIDNVIKSADMKRVMKKLLDDILSRFSKTDAFIVHKDGEVTDEEAIGIDAAAKEMSKDLKITILSFPRIGLVPLLVKLDNDYKLASSGYFFYAGHKNNQPTFLLQTHGLDMTLMPNLEYEDITKEYISTRVVSLLQFMVAKLSDNLRHELTPENVKSFYYDLVRQVYFLSRLNWGSSIGKPRRPATIHYVNKVSKLLSGGFKLEEIVWDKLWMT